MVIDTTNLPSETELIADLHATFPGLRVRSLREYGGHWKESAGAWIGGEARMPDGLPIFNHLSYGEEGYDGGIHEGFTRWLEDRGWYLECQDYGTYMAVSILDTQLQFEMSQAEIDAVAARSAQAMRDRYHGTSLADGDAGNVYQLRPVLKPMSDDEVPF